MIGSTYVFDIWKYALTCISIGTSVARGQKQRRRIWGATDNGGGDKVADEL